MDEITLGTFSQGFRKVRSVNETSNGYATLISTIGAPAEDAASATAITGIPLGHGGNRSQNGVILCPYAIGSNNNTFSMRVYGWRPILGSPGVTYKPGQNDLWVPVKLVEVACTISGTCIGLSSALVLNTEMFADTIALTGTTANANVGVELVSPADDTIGHMIVDLRGSRYWGCQFTTGGSATSCNALYAYL